MPQDLHGTDFLGRPSNANATPLDTADLINAETLTPETEDRLLIEHLYSDMVLAETDTPAGTDAGEAFDVWDYGWADYIAGQMTGYPRFAGRSDPRAPGPTPYAVRFRNLVPVPQAPATPVIDGVPSSIQTLDIVASRRKSLWDEIKEVFAVPGSDYLPYHEDHPFWLTSDWFWRMYSHFLFGQGASAYYYPDSDAATVQLRENNKYINRARQLFYQKNKGRTADEALDPVTNYATGWSESDAWWTFLDDPVKEFVGSFKLEIHQTEDGHSLDFVATNTVSLQSQFYDLPGTGSLSFDRSFEFQPMSNIYQTFEWIEPINEPALAAGSVSEEDHP